MLVTETVSLRRELRRIACRRAISSGDACNKSRKSTNPHDQHAQTAVQAHVQHTNHSEMTRSGAGIIGIVLWFVKLECLGEIVLWKREKHEIAAFSHRTRAHRPYRELVLRRSVLVFGGIACIHDFSRRFVEETLDVANFRFGVVRFTSALYPGAWMNFDFLHATRFQTRCKRVGRVCLVVVHVFASPRARGRVPKYQSTGSFSF